LPFLPLFEDALRCPPFGSGIQAGLPWLPSPKRGKNGNDGGKNGKGGNDFVAVLRQWCADDQMAGEGGVTRSLFSC
jgi:hypothetical protein